MNCPSCGFTTTEAEALFCPNCGYPLRAGQPTRPPVPAGLPSDPIYHAPTRTSGVPFAAPPVQGRADGPPTAPTHLPTSAGLYRSGALPGAPATPPVTPPVLPPGAPGARGRKPGFILAGVLILLVVFAGGIGVGAVFFGGHSKPGPGVGSGATSGPSPTATLAPSPTATPKETLIFQDALTGPTHPWPVDGGHCRFQGGSYHVLRNYICAAPVGVQSDFALSVQVKQISGAANLFYGLAFRYASAQNFYLFRINSNSTWIFYREVNGIETAVVPDTTSGLIQPGLNVVNTLLVRVKGTHFDFFVNGNKVGQADDASLAAGTLGLIGADNADIAFSNIQISTLS